MPLWRFVYFAAFFVHQMYSHQHIIQHNLSVLHIDLDLFLVDCIRVNLISTNDILSLSPFDCEILELELKYIIVYYSLWESLEKRTDRNMLISIHGQQQKIIQKNNSMLTNVRFMRCCCCFCNTLSVIAVQRTWCLQKNPTYTERKKWHENLAHE